MRALSKARFALLVVVIGLLTGGLAFADELAEFEKGRNSYGAGRYDEAEQKFAEMSNPANRNALRSPQLIERSRIYRAASLIALGRIEDADKEIETVLRANPNAYPDPVIFPGVVLDRFTDVRGRISQELEDRASEAARKERERLERERVLEKRERERIAKLEELARQQVELVQNSRWIAALPFGVGQFQNKESTLGWTYLSIEAVLATTTIITSAVAQNLSSKGTQGNVDTQDLNDRIGRWKAVNNWAFVAFVAAAVGGVVHAQLTFVPSRREVRKRELPKELRATPTVSTVHGGAVFGISSSF